MDPLLVVLTVISCVMAVLLSILAIQAFLVLREAQRTLRRINAVAEVLEHTALRTLIPLTNLGGFMTGLKSGLKMFEHFMTFLRRNADDE